MSLFNPRSWIGTCVFVLVVLAGIDGLLGHHGAPTSAVPPAATSTAGAVGDIPAAVVRDYQDAARVCPGLSWTVLAGIGKVESDHGRSQLPGVHWGANYAGAMGPMQFLAGTWAAFGAGNVYDHRDASFAAARYLCSNGGGNPASLPGAIWHYNPDWGYVALVMDWAARYAAEAGR